MSELTTDLLITNILNGMISSLNDEQLKKLKDVLHIQLHDVELSNKCYDLVALAKDNDVIKLQSFEISLRVNRKTDGTIEQYLRTATKLRTFIGKNFADITSMDIEYFLAYHHNQWKDNTVKNNIHYLQAFYNFLLKKEFITKNPMDKIESIRCEKPLKEAFCSVELEQLRLACRDSVRDIALLEFLYATGIRKDELVRLNWGDLDMQHLRFVVHGKGNKEREVLFNEKCGFYLLRYLDYRMTIENRTKEEMMDRPLFVKMRKDPKTKDYERIGHGGIYLIFKNIGKKAGVKDIYPHKIRRTFATDAINHGMPLEQLRILMGHNQYDTTLQYAHVKNTRVEQSYRMFCE